MLCNAEMACCGYSVALHEAFCEILAAFELCAQFRGANYRHSGQFVVGLEIVVYTGHERVFVSHYYHANGVIDNKLCHGGEIERRDGHIGAISLGAAVSGSYVELSQALALRQLPCNCRFSAS